MAGRKEFIHLLVDNGTVAKDRNGDLTGYY
jgi:hypothetical protein